MNRPDKPGLMQAIIETAEFVGATILGVGRIEKEGVRQGTCLIVSMPDGRTGGIWYDRNRDLQGTLTFVESRRDPSTA